MVAASSTIIAQLNLSVCVAVARDDSLRGEVRSERHSFASRRLHQQPAQNSNFRRDDSFFSPTVAQLKHFRSPRNAERFTLSELLSDKQCRGKEKKARNWGDKPPDTCSSLRYDTTEMFCSRRLHLCTPCCSSELSPRPSHVGLFAPDVSPTLPQHALGDSRALRTARTYKE